MKAGGQPDSTASLAWGVRPYLNRNIEIFLFHSEYCQLCFLLLWMIFGLVWFFETGFFSVLLGVLELTL